jgi:hypothetical protein
MISTLRLGRAAPLLALLLPLALALPARSFAQLGMPPPPRPVSGRADAAQDFTGYWVSLVTEDWRYRMITPDRGDFQGVPLNAAGRELAERWDPAQDEANGNQCKSYGAPAIMRVPTRLHISWVDDNTLRVETDAGEQVRLLHFEGKPPGDATPSWQGYSIASWEGFRQGIVRGTVAGGLAAPGQVGREGYLKVITSELRPGYLRKNGVPYGAQTSVEEYFDGFKEPNGDRWLVVTSIVTDPEYLNQPFVTSSHFKKIPDGAGWRPTPCEAR